MLKILPRLLLVVFLYGSFLATLSAGEAIVFNSTTPTNDLTGSLAAEVRFAQSQILPARVRAGDRQPHLTGHRKCLVLVRPLDDDNKTSMQMAVVDTDGKTLGIVDLDPPDQLPKTAYFLKGLPDAPVDFHLDAEPIAVVSDSGELKKLSEPAGLFLKEQLQNGELVEIQTADGRWVRDIYLPEKTDLNGKFVRVRSQAGYSSTIHYSGRTSTINRGQTLLLKAVQGQWVSEDEMENQQLTYAAATWSTILPADWVHPGVTLWFRQGDSRGRLPHLKIGPPCQLLLHTIDLGMLVPPRGRFQFANDPTAHREYFQTVPVSRMIVSQYAPLFLRRVMLPNGTLLTEKDPSKGDWHNGTMRQRIGKELISHGINNANYGLHSTAGEGEGSHPYVAAQLTAHNSCGNYSNGIVTHGGSGGGGIVTLDNTLGNEFSHEVGHNYGLGHYVGGFLGSVHRSADQVNSTWGWDADKNRFLPNFSPTRGGKPTCLQDECQEPFQGRAFGLDAMAGGSPFSDFNRFTLYTPYTTAVIQEFLEGKAVFDADSPTGFRVWNADAGAMVPYAHTVDVTEKIDADVDSLSVDTLTSLFAEYDLVRISMRDGRWTKLVTLPPASPANRGRTLKIDQAATYDSFLKLDDKTIKMSRGFKGSYTSDGRRWNEGSGKDQQVSRKPQAFGVPVTTLVGYYDPSNELVSYIYPALHGAYGFVYADDALPASDQACYLEVETRKGTLRFRLANHRLNPKVMNKFHVNIPESSKPSSVSIVCRGKVVDKQVIAAPDSELTYTVQGE